MDNYYIISCVTRKHSNFNAQNISYEHLNFNEFEFRGEKCISQNDWFSAVPYNYTLIPYTWHKLRSYVLTAPDPST